MHARPTRPSFLAILSTLVLFTLVLATWGCAPDGSDGDGQGDGDGPTADGGTDAGPRADGGDPFEPDPFTPRVDCEAEPDAPECASGFTLVSSVPADGDVDVPTNEGVLLVFSAPLDMSTADNDAVLFEGPDRKRPGSFFADDEDPARVRFISGGGMAPGTTYVMRLTTALRSTAGAPLDREVVIEFTAAGQRIPPVPRVIYTDPLGNSSSVRPDAVVRFDFNTRMDPAGFGPGAVVLADDAGGVVETVTELDARTVRVTPQTPLAIGTRYEATVPAGVRSLEGEALPEPYVLGFSTTAPLDVVGSSPFDGQTQVRIDRPLEIRMSAIIDAATVDPVNGVRVRADTWVEDELRPVIDGTTEVRGDTLIFTPEGGLWQEYGTGYTASIDFGVKGVNGEAFGASTQLTFRTIFLDPAYRYAIHDEARDAITTLALDAADQPYMEREARGPRTQWYGTVIDDDVFALHTVATGDGRSLQGGDGSAPARMVDGEPGPDQRWMFRDYNPRDALDVQGYGESPGNYYMYTEASGEDRVLTGEWDDGAMARVHRMARRGALIWQLMWFERLGPR